jgi:hypothetical protein
MKRVLLGAALSALALAACGADPVPLATSANPDPARWDERQPVVYAVVVAEVLDDVGAPPPVVYVIDGVCEEAGQVEPSRLACAGSIPGEGRRELERQLERYADVEFVEAPEDAVSADGTIEGDGLLFWFGPLQERRNGEIRVGANYASRLSDEGALGVNLALENSAGSWIVTGAAGLGGCPV